MRPIDADSLKTDYFVPSTSTGTVSTEYVSLFQILNAPTLDVAEIVRCKNCALRDDHGKCDVWSNLGVTVLTAETGFCNFGERREDE